MNLQQPGFAFAQEEQPIERCLTVEDVGIDENIVSLIARDATWVAGR